MKLSEKGRVAPPPTLREPLQRLSEIVQSWPDIVAATHWSLWRKDQVDGIDFYRGEHELGHIHLDGELHLTVPPPVADNLIDTGLANKFPYGSDWVALPIVSDEDVRAAEWLMRLAYDLLGGAPPEGTLVRPQPDGSATPEPGLAAGAGERQATSPGRAAHPRDAEILELPWAGRHAHS